MEPARNPSSRSEPTSSGAKPAAPEQLASQPDAEFRPAESVFNSTLAPSAMRPRTRAVPSRFMNPAPRRESFAAPSRSSVGSATASGSRRESLALKTAPPATPALGSSISKPSASHSVKAPGSLVKAGEANNAKKQRQQEGDGAARVGDHHSGREASRRVLEGDDSLQMRTELAESSDAARSNPFDALPPLPSMSDPSLSPEERHALMELHQNEAMNLMLLNANLERSLEDNEALYQEQFESVYKQHAELVSNISKLRMEAFQSRLQLKIRRFLQSIEDPLREWKAIEEEHRFAISRTLEGFKFAMCKVPVDPSLHFDVEEVMAAMESASSLLETLQPATAEVSDVVQELADLFGDIGSMWTQEMQALEDCMLEKEALSKLQVEERCMSYQSEHVQ